MTKAPGLPDVMAIQKFAPPISTALPPRVFASTISSSPSPCVRPAAPLFSRVAYPRSTAYTTGSAKATQVPMRRLISRTKSAIPTSYPNTAGRVGYRANGTWAIAPCRSTASLTGLPTKKAVVPITTPHWYATANSSPYRVM